MFIRIILVVIAVLIVAVVVSDLVKIRQYWNAEAQARMLREDNERRNKMLETQIVGIIEEYNNSGYGRNRKGVRKFVRKYFKTKLDECYGFGDSKTEL